MLTVTDDKGATDSVSHVVTVTAPPTFLASDDFQRTVATGWGSLDAGGAWTTTGSGLSVNGSAGLFTTAQAGSGATAGANSVSSSNADVRVQFSMDKAPTGGGMFVYVVGRRVAGVGDYRTKVWLRNDGEVGLAISRMNGNTEVATSQPRIISGLTFTPGTSLNVRFEATGTTPTTLQAKVWAAGTTEPAAWQVQATDSTAALQVPGGIGVASYLSGRATTVPITLSFDDLRVSDATTMNAQKRVAMARGVQSQPLKKVTKSNAAQLHALSKWSKP